MVLIAAVTNDFFWHCNNEIGDMISKSMLSDC